MVSILIVLNKSLIRLERLQCQIFIYGGVIYSHVQFQTPQWAENVQVKPNATLERVINYQSTH